MSGFDLFVGIDWSGAKGSWQPGLKVAVAMPGRSAPVLVDGPGPNGRWSRAAACQRIAEIAGRERALIGIDFAFGFPAVESEASPLTWADVERICAGHGNFYGGGFFDGGDHAFRDHVFSRAHKGVLFDRGARRRTEEVAGRLPRAKPSSPFLAIGPAQVGPSTVSGMRVLHALRTLSATALVIWPFGPDLGASSVVVEIFPRYFPLSRGVSPEMKEHGKLNLALKAFGSDPVLQPPLSEDEGDALVSAAALRCLAPAGCLEVIDDQQVRQEGWIFGVPPA